MERTDFSLKDIIFPSSSILIIPKLLLAGADGIHEGNMLLVLGRVFLFVPAPGDIAVLLEDGVGETVGAFQPSVHPDEYLADVVGATLYLAAHAMHMAAVGKLVIDEEIVELVAGDPPLP